MTEAFRGTEQLSLLGDEAHELTIRVGIVNPAGHLQWQYEVRNVITDELVELRSRPSADWRRDEVELLGLFAELVRQIEDRLSPF